MRYTSFPEMGLQAYQKSTTTHPDLLVAVTIIRPFLPPQLDLSSERKAVLRKILLPMAV